MSGIHMIENVVEHLQCRMRTLECTNAIMHAMLRGEKTAVCHVESFSEINLHHSDYQIDEIKPGSFKITWK